MFDDILQTSSVGRYQADFFFISSKFIIAFLRKSSVFLFLLDIYLLTFLHNTTTSIPIRKHFFYETVQQAFKLHATLTIRLYQINHQRSQMMTRLQLIDKTIQGFKNDCEYLQRQNYKELKIIWFCFSSKAIEETDPHAKSILLAYAKCAQVQMKFQQQQRALCERSRAIKEKLSSSWISYLFIPFQPHKPYRSQYSQWLYQSCPQKKTP